MCWLYNVCILLNRMDVKRAFMVALFLGFVDRYLCISVSFCSGEIVTGYFRTDEKESTLKLDGSNSAISVSNDVNALVSCTCFIRPLSSVSPDKLVVGMEYLTRTTTQNTCNKSLDVVDSDGHTLHRFGCVSEHAEIVTDDMEDGIRFRLNIRSANSRVFDDLYMVYVAPEPSCELSVRCYPPTVGLTLSSNAFSSSSTTVKPSTTRAFVKPGSLDTSIVTGVVIGPGLFFLVFISCMLVYISRRRTRRDINEKSNPSTEQLPQTRNVVGRNLTNFYDKMKTNRPLPRIPASIRNIARLKTRHNNQSGVYDSIKSNKTNPKNQLDKQTSEGSDCSYLEPAAITTISEKLMGCTVKSKSDEKPNYLELGNMHTSKQKLQDTKISADPTKCTYIHPVSNINSTDNSNKQSGKINSHGAHESSAEAHTYINTGEALSVPNCTHEKENESHDPTYMRMSSTTDACDNEKDINKGISELKDNGKEALTDKDSTGYIVMSGSHVTNRKCLVKQEDSTFPELIHFTPHERESEDVSYINCGIFTKDNTENRGHERKLRNM